MSEKNSDICLSKNYMDITEDNFKALSPEIVDTLIKKYKLNRFFKDKIDQRASFNQLLDLVHTQTFDPSLHRILLNFFNDLFNTDPVFSAHTEQLKLLFKVKLADHDSLDKEQIKKIAKKQL